MKEISEAVKEESSINVDMQKIQEGDEEETSKLSKSSFSRSQSEMSKKSKNFSDDEGSQFGSFKRHASGNSDIDLDFETGSKGNKFEFPKGILKKIMFTIFLPTHLIYWMLMPDIKRKPDISKVMLSSILIFLFSVGFAFLIFQLEVYILLATSMKMEFLGLMNGFLFGLM